MNENATPASRTAASRAAKTIIALADIEVESFKREGATLINVYIPKADKRRAAALRRLKAAGYVVNVNHALFLGIEKKR